VSPPRLSRNLHKWLALIVGVQAILWIVSGFYMVVVDLDFIHGDTLVRNLATPLSRIGKWYPLREIRLRHADIEQIRIKALPGFSGPLYELRTPDGVILADATTGEQISPLTRERVAALALHYYAGKGSTKAIDRLTGEAPLEIQMRALPLWRVTFDDWHATTLYIHTDSGDLVTRRHRSWRWFDTLWMLHIMDYESRTDVNNPWLRIVTVAGLVFAGSGIWLLWFSLRRGRAPRTR